MSAPLILMPDAVLWACTALRSALAGRSESYASNVYVGDKLPTDGSNRPIRKDRMVIVRRDGGPRLDTVREAARLGINVWATSDRDVNDLTRLVRALLWASPNGSPVVRVDDGSGPVTIPDESKQPCRYFSVDLIVRGSQIT